MSKYVTKEELVSVLIQLQLVDTIRFYGHGISPSTHKSDKWYQNIGGKCLDDVFSELDSDDEAIIKDFNLLLDHLGLEITEKKDRRIQRVKKGKK
jgi:hypothetical protein